MDDPDNKLMVNALQNTNDAVSGVHNGNEGLETQKSVRISSSSLREHNGMGEVETPEHNQMSSLSSLLEKVRENRNLVEQILAHPSAVDLMRSRLVCQMWDNIIYEKTSRRVVLQSWATQKPFEKWILFLDADARKLAFYDIHGGKWLSHYMDFNLGARLRRRAFTSARGLLFMIMFGHLVGDNLAITACSPLTGKSRLLPPLVGLQEKTKILSLDAVEVEDDNNLSYALVITGYFNKPPDLQAPSSSSAESTIIKIYTSSSDSWQSAENHPPWLVRTIWSALETSFVERFRYSDKNFILVDISPYHNDQGMGFMLFYLEERSIDTCSLLSPVSDDCLQILKHPDVEMWPLFVFERDGSLVLLMVETCKEEDDCKDLRIWSLHLPHNQLLQLERFESFGSSWTIISTMPRYILDDLHFRECRPQSNSYEFSLARLRLARVCHDMASLKCFAVGGEVPNDDQIIFMTTIHRRIYSFSFKEPFSDRSWKKIFDPVESEFELSHVDTECGESSTRASTRIIDRIVKSSDSHGICFTPRPDVVP